MTGPVLPLVRLLALAWTLPLMRRTYTLKYVTVGVMLCYAMLCSVMFCYVMSCCVMSCYVELHVFLLYYVKSRDFMSC